MGKCYVAFCKCGNAVGVASAVPEGNYTKKEIGKAVSSWIRSGLTIESMEAEEFRQLKEWGCACEKP